MKPWGWLLGIGTVAAGVLAPQGSESYVVIAGGDTHGYLSPCGCTKPMTGGIRRRATAIRELSIKGKTIILENGGLIAGHGRQDELKLETLAQILGNVDVTAVNLTTSETQLGPAAVLALDRFAKDKVVTASLVPSDRLPYRRYVVSGPFLISGVTPEGPTLGMQLSERSVPIDRAVKELLEEAELDRKKLLLMLDGNKSEAERLAKAFPTISLIQYKSTGSPPKTVEKVGGVTLVTPGETGKHVVRLSHSGSSVTSYTPVELVPGFKDDPDAARLYKTYLARVSASNLLEELPRKETEKFAGNAKCISCHEDAGKVWKDSKHALALKTLEVEGHDRDPDCVSCHVVGLESTHGFRSRKETPQLTDVGCESCHGPGAGHAEKPFDLKMPKVGEQSCVSCHNPKNSPGFNFSTYWPKIKH